MTVGELKRQLDQYADTLKVVFVPAMFCSQGYPQWHDAYLADEGNEDEPTLTILLKDETE